MAVILDADVIIAAERDRFDLQAWLTSQPNEQFEIAAITVAELWIGVERADPPHGLRRRKFLEAIISALPVLPYTEETSYFHARIWAELEESGKMIGAYDLIVAAIALQRGSSVATFNKRHFANVRGLKVLAPRKV